MDGMIIKCMDTSELTLYKENTKGHSPDQVQRIIQSLEEFGIDK